MLQYRLVPFVIFICVLVLQQSIIECRPSTQQIIIDGHEWTVPNEPGWEKVLQEAEAIRSKMLSSCATTRDCRLAVEKLRQVFLKHPVSSKYYDGSMENTLLEDLAPSIFRWG